MKNNITITQRPYKYLTNSERTNSIIILSFLLPQILLLALTKSWNALLVIFCTTFSNVLIEFIEKRFIKKSSYDYISAVINGILTGLFLPQNFPLVAVIIISFTTVFICRFFVGNLADSWINSSALTVCILWILGMKLFPSYQITHEILLSKNPALSLIQNGTFPTLSFDTQVTSFFNRTIFKNFGVSIPDGYISLFWDTHSAVPAFRFNFITLLTSVVLFSLDVLKPLVPGIFILVYSVLVYFVGPLFYSGGTVVQGDLLLALCTSGILLSALFLLQSAGKNPMTLFGKILYAFLAGITAFFVIGAGTSPSGAVFTVLAMNVISLVIQNIEHYLEMRHIKNQLLPRVKKFKEGIDA